MSGDESRLHSEASAHIPEDRIWSSSGQLDLGRSLEIAPRESRAREDWEVIPFLYLVPHIPSLPTLYPMCLFVCLGN